MANICGFNKIMKLQKLGVLANLEMSEICINPSENLIHLIDRLILEKHYDGITVLLQDNKNISHLKDVCSDAVQICVKHLIDENYKNNIELYSCCEQLLKSVAQHAGQEEVLFELLEIIESTKSDNTFTSALKCLQICLLRLTENRARAFEWALNSIQSYLSELKIPDILEKGYDEKEEKLLEQDEDVHKILTSYITIFLFYEPILKELSEIRSRDIFKDTTISKRNVLTCFILQLMGKPLALLDLSFKDSTTNLHSNQCAIRLVKNLSSLLVDPFFLLSYVEKRIRWRAKFPEDGVYELASQDIFLIDEKAPLISIGIYYYLVFVENLIPEKAPKIYRNMYFFEMCIYLVVELLRAEEPPLHYKGILLGNRIVDNLADELIDSDALDLKVHSNFCNAITNVVVYSTIQRCRKQGLILFRKYILQFKDDGKFFLLKNLIQITTHNGLLGYLIVIYKNIIADRIKSDQLPLPNYFSGWEFKNLLLKYICVLKNGTETDIMQNSEQIISALNIIRYFVIGDKENRTGFWNLASELDKSFLSPLRKALELSRAHYKAERFRVQSGEDDSEEFRRNYSVSLASGEDLPVITKEEKLNTLSCAMITFDLIESLLGRVIECMEANKPNKFE